jgi:cold shock CspA family protein
MIKKLIEFGTFVLLSLLKGQIRKILSFIRLIPVFNKDKLYMAKSHQTYSKKEIEKKKLQKRKEKEQRREDRKESSSKGQSLDDMIAYVDENGNISNTPPDLTKKKKIKAEDIQIGIPKGEKTEQGGVRRGKVTFFNDAKGYGFIKDSENQQSIFVHSKALSSPIKENDTVTFETERGFKGPNAINVKKV